MSYAREPELRALYEDIRATAVRLGIAENFLPRVPWKHLSTWDGHWLRARDDGAPGEYVYSRQERGVTLSSDVYVGTDAVKEAVFRDTTQSWAMAETRGGPDYYARWSALQRRLLAAIDPAWAERVQQTETAD